MLFFVALFMLAVVLKDFFSRNGKICLDILVCCIGRSRGEDRPEGVPGLAPGKSQVATGLLRNTTTDTPLEAIGP